MMIFTTGVLRLMAYTFSEEENEERRGENKAYSFKLTLKCLVAPIIPFYGTWVAVTTLKLWITPNSILYAEMKKRSFFKGFLQMDY